MGLSVTFVSGLRRCGKSAVIRGMIDHIWKNPPHYVRLVKKGSDKQPPKLSAKAPKEKDCGVATARWLEYDETRIYEILADALTTIHKKDRYGSVVLEADADPTLRHAYPYDHRIFVMPMPGAIQEVFRDPARAADELRRVLDDTAVFASEMFGMFSTPEVDPGDPSEERADLSKTHMRGFLYSPLGDELATRVQLQPMFHGLVESEVIVVNNKVGEPHAETGECIRRIERLLERTRKLGERHAELFFCDPCDFETKVCKKLVAALQPMGSGGK